MIGLQCTTPFLMMLKSNASKKIKVCSIFLQLLHSLSQTNNHMNTLLYPGLYISVSQPFME